MHKWCLEGKAPKKPTKIMEKCHNQWMRFLSENNIKIIKTEKKIIYKNLYHGTYDLLVDWDGIKVLIDLKFWGCWYWTFLKKEIPENHGMSASKLAKANFQTYCYAKAEEKENIEARAVIAICPEGFQTKIFSRTPSKKFEEALLFIENSKKDDF